VTLQSLIHTIGADPKLVARLDAFRKKCNIGDYERAGSTSQEEAKELRELAKDLRAGPSLDGKISTGVSQTEQEMTRAPAIIHRSRPGLQPKVPK
jgi:hypothetical protein